MRPLLILTLLLLTPIIVSAQQTPQAPQTRSYKRVALQGDGYPVELRDTACLMSERKDVVIVDTLPRVVDQGSFVLLPGADGDYLFKREAQRWRLIAKFRGKWEAEGILLESGPCWIKPPLADHFWGQQRPADVK